ncbi:MAG TPA: hypothetical protein PLQ56_17730 [Aggregatilineales bacterium]|jgi:hypothetical protein|nr:hypothetical protein [Anaerolineae bacterium]HUN08451.1 hypothetical protein [Aggregatilineales bacterium]
MAWFCPTTAEISCIEQIETVVLDTTLTENERQELMTELWTRLENLHGSRVLTLVSPEGTVLQSPFERV